jgi:hypothetical protein
MIELKRSIPPSLTLPLKGGEDTTECFPSPSPLQGEGGEGGIARLGSDSGDNHARL